MVAIVKSIKLGTHVETNSHHDELVDGMMEMIGMHIVVEKRCHGWYRDNIGFNYHKSWLLFIDKMDGHHNKGDKNG
jgi:hypothetical protein